MDNDELYDEIKKLEDMVDDNNDRIIELEVKVEQYNIHTNDRRGMYKAFIGISLAIVGSIIAFTQYALTLNP